MKKITSFAVVITLLCSCAGWQETGWIVVDTSQRTGEAVAQSAMVIMQASCQMEVDDCVERQDRTCPGYQKCKEIWKEIVNVHRLFNLACADAEKALAIGNETDARAAIARALSLLAEIKKQVDESGYMK